MRNGSSPFQTGAVLRNVHRHGLFTAALSYVRQQLAARGGMDGEVMLLGDVPTTFETSSQTLSTP